jgi:putative NADPH-quinone reductase
MKKTLVIDGHPDPGPAFCHALSQAYMEGARDAGHETRFIRLADAQFPLLRNAAEFAAPPSEPSILSARDDILWAMHIALIFPLWMGAAPALLRGFLEQAARANFFGEVTSRGLEQRLKGKSARLIVTMGMPAIVYRTAFGAHGVKSLARSVLGFAGARPVRMTLIGGIEATEAVQAGRIARVRALGAEAA